MRTRWPLLALLLAAAPAALAQSGGTRALAEQLIARSGLAEQLKGYARQIDAEIAQARGRIPEPLLAAMRDAARVTFSPAELRDDVTRTLSAEMPAEDMRQALAWLDTAPGRRVTLAEEESSASLSPEAVQAFLAAQDGKPLAPRRAELLSGLMRATRAVDQATHLAESITLGIAVGVDAAQPEQNRLGPAKVRERVQSMLPSDKLRQAIAESMPYLFAYTYRNVSDADLQAYLEFNRTPLGTRYNDAMTRALTGAVTRASLGMGPMIVRAMQRKAA
jgi:hypothetical protein